MNWRIRALLVIAISFSLFFGGSICYGGVWDNAKTFYEKYEGDAVFHATSKTDGNIYFASKGAESSSGTRYRTIGWKIKAIDKEGKVLQTIYYKLDGDYLCLTNHVSFGGYSYNLYALKLSDIKDRMTKKVKSSLEKGAIEIVLDACMIVVENGVQKGGMTDSGPSWGKVYTTYAGISKAKEWSDNSIKALKTYFDKEVLNLFHTITLTCDSGIDSVHGAGIYCYGVTAKISATAKEGYVFKAWSGTSASEAASFSVVVRKKNSWCAESTVKKLKVRYHVGFQTEKIVEKTYAYNSLGNKYLKNIDSVPGLQMKGWTEKSDSDTVMYLENESMKKQWIDRKYPKIDLYAVWDSFPVIIGKDIYLPISIVERKLVTEEYLKKYVKAIDAFEGELQVDIKNYTPELFHNLKDQEAISVTFLARNTRGKESDKTLKVTAVDSRIQIGQALSDRIRFISSKYVEALDDSSKWKINEKCIELLKKAGL